MQRATIPPHQRDRRDRAIDEMQRRLTTEHRRRLFEEATAVVRREHARRLTLDDVAGRVATSRRQLQRAYAQNGDGSFRQQLTAVRMVRAAQLLAAGRMTVAEVARRVGYRQPAQFAKAFRRHHGATPSSYRTAVAAGATPSAAPVTAAAIPTTGATSEGADR